MKTNGRKLSINDLSDAHLAQARCICDAVCNSQSMPADPLLGAVVLSRLMHWKNLGAGLHAGLNAGLGAGLRAGLDAGLHAGLGAGLNAGLGAGLNAGIKLHYCGVFWSWFLAKYLIAESWGCPIDVEKLFMLRAFCVLCPIIGKNDNQLIVLPKPGVVRWHVAGKTPAPFEFPIYELHANGHPSVEYYGVFDLYHWHNVAIPARMGKRNSERWDPRWLLDEPNAEVRRVLIRELGYERVLATLGGKVLDSWREYQLVDLSADLRVKYRLLTMVCPSTGDTHVLRVPPDCERAEAAITWVNHGHHPDQFVSQA